MKNQFCLISLFITFGLIANNPIEPTHQISAVTVFSKGAMVSRDIETNTLLGEHTLSIKNLPSDIYKKSIILESNDNVEVKSINHFLTSSPEKYQLQIDSLNDANQLLIDSISLKNTLLNILMTEKNMITSHNDFTNNEGNSNIEDVIKASDFYKKRIKEIDLAQLHLRKEINNYNTISSKNKAQINTLYSKRNKQTYQVDIKVKIKKKGSENITLKYFVPNAQWHPFYDLKVKDIQSPTVLFQKAFVSQNTGETWTDVQLTLSNANPTESNELPVLNPSELTSPEQRLKTIKGKVLDQSGEPLIGANIIIEGTSNGTISDLDGNFVLNHASHRNIIVSYVGFETKSIRALQDYSIIVLSESMLLDEVVVSHAAGYNSRNKLEATVDGLKINKKRNKDLEEAFQEDMAMAGVREAINLSKTKAITSVEYRIEEKYSLPSDNKEIDVLLETKSIPCTYEYFAIPSQSPKTFLTLKIEDWYKLDLLPGAVNLFMAHTYKGSSYLNPNVSDKTLSISIGSDPEVVVTRQIKNEFYEKKIFNKNIEEYFSYSIKIKNNKSYPIRIQIQDQVPISQHENIEIKNIKCDNAIQNENSGQVTWNLEIGSGETKDEALSYSIKYPKEFNSIF